MQDDNGSYIRDGFAFDELLNLVLGMDGLQSILNTMLPQIRINTDNEEFKAEIIKDKFSVGDLLKRLGLNLMLSDKMDDGFKLDVKARLNMQAMGMEDITKIDFGNLDVNTILKGLEASIGIDFDYEHEQSNAYLNIYLLNGDVYVDLAGIGGPRVQVGLFELLGRLGVDLASSSDASTADDTTTGDTQDKGLDVAQLLNTIVPSSCSARRRGKPAAISTR